MRFCWHLEILRVNIFPGQWGLCARCPLLLRKVGPFPSPGLRNWSCAWCGLRSRLFWEKLQARGQLAGRPPGFLTVTWEGLLEQDSGAPVGPPLSPPPPPPRRRSPAQTWKAVWAPVCGAHRGSGRPWGRGAFNINLTRNSVAFFLPM